MNALWVSLVSLGLVSALVPVQVAITLLLTESARGRITAVMWVAGMTGVRIAQGVIFGLVLSTTAVQRIEIGGSGAVVSTAFLMLGVLLLAAAAQQALTAEDPDRPPRRWLAAVERMSPGRALLLGAGSLAISAKLWLFTLGAIAAVHDARLDLLRGTVAFLLFIVIAEAIHLTILGLAIFAPRRSAAVLAGATTWLRLHNDRIMIAVSTFFGLLFLVKALDGYGIL